MRNSVHLFQNKKWYSKKRPKLQLDILACLVLRGRLTKGQAEDILDKRRHADILKSFDILEKKGLIKKRVKIFYLEEEGVNTYMKLQH